MKKLLITFLLLTATVSAVTIPVTEKKPNCWRHKLAEVTELINAEELTEELLLEMLADLRPNSAIVFTEGMHIPVALNLSGDIFNATNQVALPVNKTIYLRFCHQKPLLSSDLLTWKEFHNFFYGNLSVTFSNSSPGVSLNVELNEKE